MLNPLKYAEDFKKLGLNEAEQQVVLDYFHQLGIIIFNNKNLLWVKKQTKKRRKPLKE